MNILKHYYLCFKPRINHYVQTYQGRIYSTLFIHLYNCVLLWQWSNKYHLLFSLKRIKIYILHLTIFLPSLMVKFVLCSMHTTWCYYQYSLQPQVSFFFAFLFLHLVLLVYKNKFINYILWYKYFFNYWIKISNTLV